MFPGSNCSSGSEGDPVALHAGICVRQQSVSTKDSLIAGEASEPTAGYAGGLLAIRVLGNGQVSVGNYLYPFIDKVILIEMEKGKVGIWNR